MFIDTPTAIIAVLICVVAWQQWNILILQSEMDETIDSHNDFVDAVNEAFTSITSAIKEIETRDH
jgi:transcription elongation factor Elf1